MDLILLVLVLAVVGAVVWFITTKIPMDPMFRTVIYLVVAVVLVLYLINRFGKVVPNLLP